VPLDAARRLYISIGDPAHRKPALVVNTTKELNLNLDKSAKSFTTCESADLAGLEEKARRVSTLGSIITNSNIYLIMLLFALFASFICLSFGFVIKRSSSCESCLFSGNTDNEPIPQRSSLVKSVVNTIRTSAVGASIAAIPFAGGYIKRTLAAAANSNSELVIL
jgi:hypothetical protein